MVILKLLCHRSFLGTALQDYWVYMIFFITRNLFNNAPHFLNILGIHLVKLQRMALILESSMVQSLPSRILLSTLHLLLVLSQSNRSTDPIGKENQAEKNEKDDQSRETRLNEDNPIGADKPLF